MLKRNSHLLFLAVFFLTMIFLKTHLLAEAVFLKDGSIIEGKIQKETNQSILLRTPGNKQRTIPRKQIMHILFNDDYKRKVYIYKMDNTLIESHIVSENADSYVCRNNLSSNQETTILKKDVNFVSKTKITIAGGDHKNQDSIRDDNQKTAHTDTYSIKGLGFRFSYNYEGILKDQTNSTDSSTSSSTFEDVLKTGSFGLVFDSNIAGNRVFNFRLNVDYELGSDKNGNKIKAYSSKINWGFAPMRGRKLRLWFGPQLSAGYAEKDLPYQQDWKDTSMGFGLVLGINLHILPYISLCIDGGARTNLHFISTKTKDLSTDSYTSSNDIRAGYHGFAGLAVIFRFGDYK